MNKILKPFAVLATALRSNEFIHARVTLTALYAAVLFLIVSSFSVYVHYEVKEGLAESLLRTTTVSEEEVRAIAEDIHPGPIIEVAIETRFNSLVYAVEVREVNDSETDVFVDAYTGEVLGIFPESVDAPESWSEAFLNDLAEHLILASLGMIVLFSVCGYFLAGLTLRPIQKKLAQHEQFSADVSHELRTPLAALQASLEAALRIGDEEAYQRTIENGLKEVKRLTTLTKQLLKTNYKIETFEPVPLDEIVERVVSNLSPLSAQRGISIQTNLYPVTVVGNPHALEELTFNLLHNAIKFSHDNNVVEIILSKDKVLSVTDTGIGIPTDQKNRIFDRFYIIDAARSEDKDRGFGLGLAIVKKIVDDHKATITVESEQGKGSAFRVSFLQ